MLIGEIVFFFCKWRSRSLAVVVSAVVAWLAVVATMPMAPEPMVAGVAQVTLMQDEHALVADYVSRKADAERAAGLAESRQRDQMRALALDAAAVPLPKPQPIRLAASAKTVVAADPSPPPATPAAPLQLQSASSPSSPAPKGARAVLATVERVPALAWTAVRNAADWAIIGPVQTIARLPERRFL